MAERLIKTSAERQGERFFLMQSEEYGEDTEHVIVDEEGRVVQEGVLNGFGDFDFSGENAFVLRPAYPDERKYAGRQSTQIQMKTGNIGFWRARMEEDGKVLLSNWEAFRPALASTEFLVERDRLAAQLRKGALKNRNALRMFCKKNPLARSGSGAYLFRADSGEYTFLISLNPTPETDDVSMCCYQREWLLEHRKNAAKGICLAGLDVRGEMRITDGAALEVSGLDGETRKVICRYVDEEYAEADGQLIRTQELSEAIAKAACRFEKTDIQTVSSGGLEMER